MPEQKGSQTLFASPLLLLLALSMGACNSGSLSVDSEDAGPDGDESCASGCPAGTICSDGECVPLDEACDGVVCQEGTHCEHGVCVEGDPCSGVICANPGEVCRDGECVAGEADEDGDGVAARDDCDDTDAAVYPGAPERCNGISDACVETFVDGVDECPDLCCGAPPACQECCDVAHCGEGPWSCDANLCVCTALLCGERCLPEGSCCAASDCGTGAWLCEEDACDCPGVVCDGVCFATGDCCAASDCGSGEWGCSDRECSCDLIVVSGRCGLCAGPTYAGHGCGACPRGSFEVYCPGPGCSRACVTDDSCSNRYKHDASDPWIDYAHAFCFSGTTSRDLYWEMR